MNNGTDAMTNARRASSTDGHPHETCDDELVNVDRRQLVGALADLLMDGLSNRGESGPGREGEVQP